MSPPRSFREFLGYQGGGKWKWLFDSNSNYYVVHEHDEHCIGDQTLCLAMRSPADNVHYPLFP